MRDTTILSTTVLLLFAACKKSNNVPDNNSKKITSATIGDTKYLFGYDNEGQLNRIDYGISSHLKIEYSAVGVVMQWYDADGNAMPRRRVECNVLNGRINQAKQIRENNVAVWHNYTYDANGKLTKHETRQTNDDKWITQGTWGGSKGYTEQNYQYNAEGLLVGMENVSDIEWK